MNLPSLRGVRLPLFTLSALLFILLFWLLQPADEVPEQPMPDWERLDQGLLQPLAAGTLDLARLREQAPGALWLQARLDGSRLLHRAELRTDAAVWQLQAEVAVAPEVLEALRSELGLQNTEQRLESAQLERFQRQPIESLWLQADPQPTASAWIASAGEPRLRLQMPPAQAWVYPPRGLTAHVEDGQVTLIQQVPARAMRGSRP
ncbi:hypothetical protein [Pseudomonas mangrovi]|uniref:Uncharacterized protein n=1 Tax=Pseudomonas mangrovi TaxID=2161748 RepID=A0A2T5P998_9PSED|nr:hypothetical protein [Pseudomonas mangrovi]PTU74324.1 hypothetical protein DBO85_09495 [Pseudomonas mangrovi]